MRGRSIVKVAIEVERVKMLSSLIKKKRDLDFDELRSIRHF